MNFLPTLSAWQWALIAVVPPAVVALYFLKLRRQPLEVPSTYLWQKSIEDLHVNSLWQRIRQNLLMYLQLLLLLLVIFALLRPGWRSGKLQGGRYIFLIDNSASMNSTDVAPSRLAEAKRQATVLIDEMASGDNGMVISFSDLARVEQGFTDNRRELRRAVENIHATNRTTAIDEALRAAAGLANPGRTTDESKMEAKPAKVFIFSDGKFPPVQGFSLGNLDPMFVPIGKPDVDNLGIVAFGVRRNDERENQLQAFGNIENFSDAEAKIPVDLLLNGNPIDASQVTVKAGETAGVSFNLGEIESGILELRLATADAFAADNEAWAAVNASRRPKVLLVTPGNEALELALATPRCAEMAEVSKASPELLKTKEHQRAAAGGAFDLIIYDRCKPEQFPRANTLFIGETPPPLEAQSIAAKSQGGAESTPASSTTSPTTKGWSLGESVTYPQIIDVDHQHPLTQWLLDLGDVDIVEARPVSAPPGGTRLIDSNKGTLLAIASREGFEDAVLGFSIYGVDAMGERVPNTNWPIRRSWPSFVFSVLSYLGGNEGAQAGETVKPGQAVTLKSDSPADQLQVRSPGGANFNVPRGQAGAFHFNNTDELGPYEVLDGSKTIERFTVNLFDQLESSIRPAKDKTIQIGHVSVEGSSPYEAVRQETWKWLLLAGLAVLMLEWYIYNRRVSV